jgi:error-prone DNA polymerase
MATFKHTGGVSAFKEKLVHGMVERGYTPHGRFRQRRIGELVVLRVA